MRSTQSLLSAIHLTIALMVLTVGVLFIIIPFAGALQEGLIASVRNGKNAMIMIGSGIIIAGGVLLVGFYQMHKRRYYTVIMGSSQTLIEDSVIREYIIDYWKKLFPETPFDLDITIAKGQKLEISVQMPIQSNLEEPFFEQVENELTILLAKKIGYQKEFTLTLID